MAAAKQVAKSAGIIIQVDRANFINDIEMIALYFPNDILGVRNQHKYQMKIINSLYHEN